MTKDVKKLVDEVADWIDVKPESRAAVLVTFDHSVKACESNCTFIGGPHKHVVVALGSALLANDSILGPVLEEAIISVAEFQKYKKEKDDGGE